MPPPLLLKFGKNIYRAIFYVKIGHSAGARELEPPPGGLSEAPPPGPQRGPLPARLHIGPSLGPHSCIWAPKYNCEAPYLIFKRK